MGKESTIEWTDSSWNPVRGCRRVSPGCERCYAEVIAGRFSGPGLYAEGLATFEKGRARWTGVGRLVPSKLDEPLQWKKPRRIFVNSTSDLFFEEFTNEQIAAIFGIMMVARQHTFQVLTKRAMRMYEWFRWIEKHAATVNGSARPMSPGFACLCYAQKLCAHPLLRRTEDIQHLYAWPLPNVWLGVSVENQAYANERIPLLCTTPARTRFVSYEPALGPVALGLLGVLPGVMTGGDYVSTYQRLHWVIVGGESGPKARPFNIDWARSTVAQCREAGVACFVKQLGAVPVSRGIHVGADFKDSHGGNMDEWPADLRVREFPRKDDHAEDD